MEETTLKTWVAGACIKENKVLLVHRINEKNLFNREYFVFPGKEVSEDETIEDALEKAFDDFSITIKRGEQIYSNEDEPEEKEYYYLCEHVLGEPHVTKDSNEAKEMEEGGQVFIPVWVSLEEIDELIIYPESVKDALVTYYEERSFI